MADTPDTVTPARRRPDARRSTGAITSAARTVPGQRPGASIQDIAAAHGAARPAAVACSWPAAVAPLTALTGPSCLRRHARGGHRRGVVSLGGLR